MDKNTVTNKFILTAGGTGGHIFPALSFALQLRRQCPDCELVWIGTTRSRERELCEKNDIRFIPLQVQGLSRKLSPKSITALAQFVKAIFRVRSLLGQERPQAVIAFGGYVCAPVLTAARLRKVAYFLQEQNTVPGLVNRLFAAGARCSFLGFELDRHWQLKGKSLVTGNPIRTADANYVGFAYPQGMDLSKKIVLISGGSQGAASMNKLLVAAVRQMLQDGLQVVWQTGEASYEDVKNQLTNIPGSFVFDSIPDLYPFYARAHCVVCRAGASTLSEVAYFGLPCVMIPLPWAAENHQWLNAGLAEAQGWGVRVAQDEKCGDTVLQAVRQLFADTARHERMSQSALNYSPVNAASEIVKEVLQQVRR
jgi:UDP-N-acetylglucosamine--N-acetylmuramyl-(pentapeptide) pyrophosphoryl-undecaprenol N-acetylglucosamine transferase